MLLASVRDAATDEAPVILVLGDSISAAYGLSSAEGWVTLLQNRLRAQGYGHRVVNASVSGETTTGGRIADLLFELNATAHTTLVLVTHDRTLAARCARMWVMDAGRLAPGA